MIWVRQGTCPVPPSTQTPSPPSPLQPCTINFQIQSLKQWQTVMDNKSIILHLIFTVQFLVKSVSHKNSQIETARGGSSQEESNRSQTKTSQTSLVARISFSAELQKLYVPCRACNSVSFWWRPCNIHIYMDDAKLYSIYLLVDKNLKTSHKHGYLDRLTENFVSH